MKARETESSEGTSPVGQRVARQVITNLVAAALLPCLLVACQPSSDSSAERTDEPKSEETSARSISDTSSRPAANEAVDLPAFSPTPDSDLLLITIDTLRADALGFSGNSEASTPFLDRLADSGRVFPNAHAHNVVTLPSHTNILTGRYPYEHGVRDNSGFTVPEDLPTLATRLRAAGYRTAAFVSAYPLDSVFGLDRGFEVYDDEFVKSQQTDEFSFAERPGRETTEKALAWWHANEGSKRFLWLHVFDPHTPYEPPEPFASRFPGDPYAGEVSAADDALGLILKPILDCRERSTACADKTFVAVTADHGESLGEHGEASHGLFAYEATLRVPMVVWGPGIEPAVDPRAARHVDLKPTLLGALGLEVAEDLPGRSLLDPVEAEIDTYFEALSTNLNRGWAPLRGVIHDHKKAIHLPLPELYDLIDDPAESENLVDTQRRQFRTLLKAIPAQAYEKTQRLNVSPEAEARLRSLGYFTGPGTSAETFGPEDDPKTLIGMDAKLHETIELFSTGRVAEAAQLASELVAARPQMPNGYSLLAQALIEIGALPQAVAAMEAARDHGVASESLLIQLGLTLTELGRAQEALPILSTVAESTSASELTSALNALGLAQAGLGQFATAEATFRRVIELEPRNGRAYENLGMVDLQRQRWGSAERWLRRALEINPELAESWNMLGVAIFSDRRDVAATIDAWQRCLAIDPRQPNVLINLGSIAFEAGRYDIARPALRRFLEVAPSERYGADRNKAQSLLGQMPS